MKSRRIKKNVLSIVLVIAMILQTSGITFAQDTEGKFNDNEINLIINDENNNEDNADIDLGGEEIDNSDSDLDGEDTDNSDVDLDGEDLDNPDTDLEEDNDNDEFDLNMEEPEISTLFSGYDVISIYTAEDLDNIRNHPSGNYRLEADIDLSGYISKTNTESNGWYPIGYGNFFTGTFDGNGYTIRGLWSSGNWGISYKGLFSVLYGAEVKDLNIELDSRGITGGYEIGGLAGNARNGTVIRNVTVTGGQVIVTGGGYAGGIIGFSYGSPSVTIDNCTVTDTYVKTSGNYSGGIVGVADGGTQVINSKTKDVTVNASSYSGGIAGALKGRSSIYKTTADAEVTALYYAGGLVGTMYENSSISESSAYGSVSTRNYIAGGLVGEVINSTIDNSYARSNVSGTTGVGGLVGYFSGAASSNSNSVENCYSSGTVSGTGTTEYGAFSGHSGVTFMGTNYYDADTAIAKNAHGTSGSPKGNSSAFPVGKSTSEMMQRSTYMNWDFDNIWTVDTGNDYPVLKHEGKEFETDIYVKINVDSFEEHGLYEKQYFVYDKIDKLEGQVVGTTDIETIHILINSFDKDIVDTFIEAEPNWVYNEAVLMIGFNYVTVTVTLTSGEILVEKIILINENWDNAEDLDLDWDDTDGDDIPNWFEDYIGTDKNNADTDGDGLTDFDELYFFGTDPLLKDTDGNGINDGDEDFDGDGLTNLEEMKFGSNPFKVDTDGDGLDDYTEYLLGTDPNNRDTDGDGLPDALELELGTDPLNPDSNYNGILDGDEIYTITRGCDENENGDSVKPYITVDIPGKNIETIDIKKIQDDDLWLHTEIPGYIFNGYDFNIYGDFDNATMSFELSSAVDMSLQPTIYYWDEDLQFLVELDTTVNGNTISTEVEHFSKYIVLYKALYDLVWEVIIQPPTDGDYKTAIDLVLVLDDSGSIGAANFETIKQIASDMIDRLEEGDRVAVVKFGSTVTTVTDFTDKDTASGIVNDMAYGNQNSTALYSAIESANSIFVNGSSDDINKIMIVLTDGARNAGVNNPNNGIATAIENEIVIYTVGLGSSVSTSVLINIAESTGGNYYNAANVNGLYEIFERLSENVDLYRDSDNDGISDYHEKKIAEGQLLLGNGTPLVGTGIVMDYLNPDSDGDGLLDGEEISISVIESFPKMMRTESVGNTTFSASSLTYASMVSSPLSKDSDGDGIPDYLDPTPLVAHDSRFVFVDDENHRPVNPQVAALKALNDANWRDGKLEGFDPGPELAHIASIKNRAQGQVTYAGPIYPTAASALQHFINNTGKKKTFNISSLVTEETNGAIRFSSNLNTLLNQAELMTFDNASSIIATKYELNDEGECINPFYCAEYSNGSSSMERIPMDWFFTIGDAQCSMVAKIDRNGSNYTMNLYYYLDDYYDFEYNWEVQGGLLFDAEMYLLHHAGYARHYEVDGVYKAKITWKEGDRYTRDGNSNVTITEIK